MFDIKDFANKDIVNHLDIINFDHTLMAPGKKLKKNKEFAKKIL